MKKVVESNKRDASLPRFLVVDPSRNSCFEEWLGPFLALGCELEQVGSVAEVPLEAAPDLVLYVLDAGIEGLDALRKSLPGSNFMVVGPKRQRALAEQALADGAHEWLCAELDGEAEGAFDAIERMLLFGPRAALPRRRARPGAGTTSELLARREAAAPAESSAQATPPAPRAAERPTPRPAPLPQSPLPAAEPAPAPAPGREPEQAEPAGAQTQAPEATATPLEPDGPIEPAPLLTRSLAIQRLYEVEPDGGPARRPVPVVEHQSGSGERLDLVLACVQPFTADTLIVGVHTPSGLHYGCYEVLARFPLGDWRYAVECVLARPERDLLAATALLPTLDTRTMRYRPPAIGERARAWVELGVLAERELDRVLVCPRCQALPTFRHACKRCGCAALSEARMIHHFPCAHVGPISDYQLDGILICPKCAARPLIVNSDFEYLEGPVRCAECGAQDGQTELIGHCFDCELRFVARVATPLVLKGYDAPRLAALDLGLSS